MSPRRARRDLAREQPRAVLEAVASRLPELFDSAPTPSALLDPDGVVLVANRALNRLLCDGGDLTGTSILSLTHHDEDRAAFAAALLRQLEPDQVPEALEVRWRRVDGSTASVVANLGPIPDPDGGAPVGFILQAHDVTDARETERHGAIAETIFRTLVEQGPGVVYLHDLGEAPAWIKYVSPQIEEMLGYPASSWTEDPRFWLTMVHPDDLTWFPQRDEAAIREGRDLDVEYRFLHRDGHVVWVHDTAAIIRDADGTPIARQGLMVDITARREAELRLIDAEARYRSLVEAGPGVVYLNDPSVVPPAITYMAPQIEDLLGYPSDDFVVNGGLWARLIHPDDRAWVHERTTTAVAATANLELEYRMVARDGRSIWIHDSARVVRTGPSGGVARQGIVVDITEARETRERLAAMEGRYRSLLERLPIATYSGEVEWSPGSTHYVSSGIERLSGYTVAEWMDGEELWFTAIHPDDLPSVLEAWNRTVRDGSWPCTVEYRIVRKDGGIVWVRDIADLSHSNGDAVADGVLIDMTDRRRAEEALASRTEELRQANERLLELDRIRGEFFTTASHELRTPLTSILGYLDVADHRWEELSDAERRSHIRTARRNSLRMSRLVADCLIASEMDQGVLTLNLEPVDIAAVARTVARIQAPSFTDDVVRVEGHGIALADPERLEQILSNLIANALRYGEPPVIVETRIVETKHGGDLVEILVRDHGPGVPADLRDRLFERFALSDETEQRIQQGFGLGLSVARDLARMHGGDLHLGVGEEGSTFVLALPAAKR